MLRKMLPVKNPKGLCIVARSPDLPGNAWSYPDYAAARDHNTGLAGFAAYSGLNPASFSTGANHDAQASLAHGLMVSVNYFSVLGVGPALGRLLNTEDERVPGASPHIVDLGTALLRDEKL